MKKSVVALIIGALISTTALAQVAKLSAIFPKEQILTYDGEKTVFSFSVRYEKKEEMKALQDRAANYAPSRLFIVDESGETESKCRLVFTAKVPEISIHKMLLTLGFSEVEYDGKKLSLDEFSSRLSTEIK